MDNKFWDNKTYYVQVEINLPEGSYQSLINCLGDEVLLSFSANEYLGGKISRVALRPF